MGIKPRLSMGGLGVLDVFADGNLIFSYKQSGRMPTDEEILNLLAARGASKLQHV